MKIQCLPTVFFLFCLIYRSATPQTRSPGGSSTGAERDSSGAITKDRTVSCNETLLHNFVGAMNFTKKMWHEIGWTNCSETNEINKSFRF